MFLATYSEGRKAFLVTGNYHNVEVFQGILYWAKENLTREEVYKLLATVNEGKTVFHVAAEFSEVELFQGIMILAKRNLTTGEVEKRFQQQTEWEGRSFI